MELHVITSCRRCPQVALCNRYGNVTMYDDTAVKNRYRMPIGVLVIVDGDFNTRIVGQSITADTTADTFVWILKAYVASRGGRPPSIFIDDAGAAMAGAVTAVMPDAEKRRCLWYLYQDILKALATILGTRMNVRAGPALFSRGMQYTVQIYSGRSYTVFFSISRLL